MRYPVLILFLALGSHTTGFAQSPGRGNIPGDLLLSKASFTQTDSGLFIFQPVRSGCKAIYNIRSFIPNPPDDIAKAPVKQMNDLPAAFLTIHGNITYNFNYRSYIDTPFAENNMMQHSVQTRLNLKFRDKYPVTMFLTTRISNSPYFSNATDVSFRFRQEEMLEDIKRKMRAGADTILYNKSLFFTPAQIYEKEKEGLLREPGRFPATIKNAAGKYVDAQTVGIEEKFKKLYKEYKTKMDRLSALLDRAKHADEAQKLVAEKEKKLRGRQEEIRDSLKKIFKENAANTGIIKKTDSTIRGAKQLFAERKKEIDSITKEVAVAEKELKIFQKKITDSLQQIKKQIAGITNKDGLYAYLQKRGESLGSLTPLQKTLLSIKQIGIGRSWIDYSELTVKNISLSGFNIEANPGNIYLAAAAGKVNYRFRDYIVKGNYAGAGQSVALLRAGFGKKDGNNIILTYYTGKKALLNQRSIADSAAVQKISGFSIETKAALDANNYIIGEYARSVSPNIAGKILDFKSHTNEAWSIKLFSHYGNTKITSYYRKTGEGFQSFTLFPTNNKQDAWMVRVNQSFWKNRIVLDGAIRKNDFTSPLALPGYSNKNIFKSFQLTERIPKYPFLSVGYYPSSQLTLGNGNILYENRYNTFNAIISHSYFFRKLNMNSNATYTKFYNSGIDTGFIYYNASTFTLNQSVIIKSFTLEGMVTLTDQSLLHQLVLEPGLVYKIKSMLSVSGSVKWSRVNHNETLWGGSAGLNFYFKKIGTIQMQYDKIYLPGYNRNLLPVDMGRLVFSREF